MSFASLQVHQLLMIVFHLQGHYGYFLFVTNEFKILKIKIWFGISANSLVMFSGGLFIYYSFLHENSSSFIHNLINYKSILSLIWLDNKTFVF